MSPAVETDGDQPCCPFCGRWHEYERRAPTWADYPDGPDPRGDTIACSCGATLTVTDLDVDGYRDDEGRWHGGEQVCWTATRAAVTT